jgi:hypothetical protein
VALAAACSVDTTAAPEEVGSTEEALVCSNDAATNAVIAAMAVAAGKDFRRFLPFRDFECEGPSNIGTDANYDGLVDRPGQCIRWASQFKIKISPKGFPRCQDDPNTSLNEYRQCYNTRALLDLQNDAATGMYFAGQRLDAGVLRSRLYSYWQRQETCVNRPDNHAGDDCPVEYHDLYFRNKVPSVSCAGGSDYWFDAWKMGSPGVSLAYPWQLKNMLLWAGQGENPWLAFDAQGDGVKLDPGGGMNDGDNGTSSGSCLALCSKYSLTAVTGCCTCTKTVNGVETTINGNMVPKTGVTNFYVCQ